jgi:hypothetical protein
MFSTNLNSATTDKPNEDKPNEDKPNDDKQTVATNIVQSGGNYYSMYNDKSSNNQYNDTNPSNVDELLEYEKSHNKNETWNKLDNISKKQVLQSYADKYGLDNNLTGNEIVKLKSFFNDAIQKNKLKKTKEVQYNKDTRIVLNIPSLVFNATNRSFTLRNTDKRVSTLKYMTPKRISNKNKTTVGKIE